MECNCLFQPLQHKESIIVRLNMGTIWGAQGVVWDDRDQIQVATCKPRAVPAVPLAKILVQVFQTKRTMCSCLISLSATLAAV